jgi:succinoglycan biosynthesis protein ExoM
MLHIPTSMRHIGSERGEGVSLSTAPAPSPAGPGRRSRITVAVLTYQRPDGIARILPQLLEQADSVTPRAEVLVIDNDPAASARPLADATDGVRYVHEPQPGIAAARNRALAETSDIDAVVFVDDDEEPSADWLAALVAVWRRTGPAAVTGPVEPEFAAPPSRWLLACGRFDRRRTTTGTVMRSAASNNLLLDRAAIERLDLRFDDSFGLTGGEDTAFTRELVQRGGLIVWCDEAPVRDHVPAERMSRSWVLRREFRSGTSWSRMRLVSTPRGGRPLVRLDLAARGILRVTGALFRWGWGAITLDITHRARGACLAASNAGLVAGAFGHRYREYGREGR